MNSKYAAPWLSPKGPGDSRPTARQILEDESRVGNLPGKAILITGCSSGLGIETARALKATGATLFLTARNLEKAKQALSGILDPDSTSVQLLHLDLESLDSVRACAADLKTRTQSLNILINNAGVRHTPKGTTKEGFETQFGINHIAHFLLFQLLKPMLLASSTPDFQSRVIAVSSTAHRTSRLDFIDLNMQKRGYDPVVAYGQSKLANVYMALEIERRYGAQGIHAWSVHPGGIRTGLQRFSWADMFMVLRAGPVKTMNVMQNAEQGASTCVWAAVARELEGRGGKYLERCAVGEVVKKGWGPIDPGHAVWAYDAEDAKRCWVESVKMVGIKDEDYM